MDARSFGRYEGLLEEQDVGSALEVLSVNEKDTHVSNRRNAMQVRSLVTTEF